jgi:hypothetical protein
MLRHSWSRTIIFVVDLKKRIQGWTLNFGNLKFREIREPRAWIPLDFSAWWVLKSYSKIFSFYNFLKYFIYIGNLSTKYFKLFGFSRTSYEVKKVLMNNPEFESQKIQINIRFCKMFLHPFWYFCTKYFTVKKFNNSKFKKFKKKISIQI